MICKSFGCIGRYRYPVCLPNTVQSRVHSVVLEIFQDLWRPSKSRWVRQTINTKPIIAINCLGLFRFSFIGKTYGAQQITLVPHPLPPAIFSLGLMMPHTAKWCFYEPVSEFSLKFSEILILFWWTDFDF